MHMNFCAMLLMLFSVQHWLVYPSAWFFLHSSLQFDSVCYCYFTVMLFLILTMIHHRHHCFDLVLFFSLFPFLFLWMPVLLMYKQISCWKFRILLLFSSKRPNYFHNVHFYARQCSYSAYMPWQFRPSVCLSHGWISQKRLKLRSRNFHHTVAPSL